MEKAHITDFGNEKSSITTDPKDIKNIIREYY